MCLAKGSGRKGLRYWHTNNNIDEDNTVVVMTEMLMGPPTALHGAG